MTPLIVVDNPDRWPFALPNVEVVSARAYLTQPQFAVPRQRRIFNLCRSYTYQSNGYYVSLLAEARGQRALPSVETIQGLKSQALLRLASDELDEDMQKALHDLPPEKFTLNMYFGRNQGRRQERLCKQLYALFPAPLLRAEFECEDGTWVLKSVDPIASVEVPHSHRPFVAEMAAQFFAGRTPTSARKKKARYSMAILVEPGEGHPPSNEKALQRFTRVAEAAGFDVDRITRDDGDTVGEYDALFIRVTTSVHHYTYRLARKAVASRVVVIDDPVSIIKCSNKVFLGELLARHRIPTPRTIIVHEDNADEVPARLGFPLILKQPDSAFSRGVIKVENETEYQRRLVELLDKSDLAIAQEYLYTAFDWRIGVLDGKALFACQYFMARKHWQVYRPALRGPDVAGPSKTIPVELAPRNIVRTALKAAELIGDGFYGVDVKEVGKRAYVIEVNDNPNLDAGVEDEILRETLYERLVESFLRRIEDLRDG